MNAGSEAGQARTSYAAPGLHFYDNDVVSNRGRPEAVAAGGVGDHLIAAGEFARTVGQRQGLKIGCPEELAWRLGLLEGVQDRLARERC